MEQIQKQVKNQQIYWKIFYFRCKNDKNTYFSLSVGLINHILNSITQFQLTQKNKNFQFNRIHKNFPITEKYIRETSILLKLS